MRTAQRLAEKHEAEVTALEVRRYQERKDSLSELDEGITALVQQQESQEKAMLRRHAQEFQEFKIQAEESVPKPKWWVLDHDDDEADTLQAYCCFMVVLSTEMLCSCRSKALLNSRKIEEHLLRQLDFAQAAKVGDRLTVDTLFCGVVVRILTSTDAVHIQYCPANLFNHSII